jgi:HlyD family secretion protein
MQEGDRISAGGVLAQVRQSDYHVKLTQAESQAHETRSGIDTAKADYQQALSDIEKSKAQLVEAEASNERAKLDFDRAQNLFASKSMTKANYDAAKEQFDVTAAKVAAARSQVEWSRPEPIPPGLRST